MKLAYVAAAGVLALVVGLVAAQVVIAERQAAEQQRRVAEYEAALPRWQAQQPPTGQPWLPQPMPLPPPTPLPPPIVHVFYAPLMGALALLVLVQQQREQRARHAEEEDQTGYTAEDLMSDWEFKIIRNCLGLFDRSEFLERILREEATAGWKLVEKFDGTRVRLKRPASRPPAADLPPGYDPYRTRVGPRVR